MKISIAKTAGFCMGVQRAVELALDASNTCDPPIYTYGPLIHNPQVLELLQEKGITALKEIPESGSGTVIIRAHGVPPDTRERLEKSGFQVIDATCPRVIRVQTIIRKHALDGYDCIIIGDADHPEVIGLTGYAGDRGHVAGTLGDLEKLPAFEKAIVVAQTTQNMLFYKAVKKWAAQNYSHYKIFDTICDSTEKRQEEAKRLAGYVDAVVVVGGHNSGNTQRLAETVREAGKPAYHIETEEELNIKNLADLRHIGITAGASTPNWIIKRIFRAIESMPFNEGGIWKRRIYTAQRHLLLTNIYIALGAGCLSLAGTRLQNLHHTVPYIVIAILYVLSMHILNNLTGMKEARYNDPDRAVFCENHKAILTTVALLSGAIGLITAASMGMVSFFILFVMTLLGLSYNLKLIPDTIVGIKYHRIRDLPGSKTILIALAWGIVTTLFPALAMNGSIKLVTIVSFLWVTGLVFTRTAFFDVLDMQGDRIVGKETLPIFLGKKQSLRLLKIILLLQIFMMYMAEHYGIVPGLGLWLAVCPLFLLILVISHKKGYMQPGHRLEFLTETQFIIAGLITLIWLVHDRLIR